MRSFIFIFPIFSPGLVLHNNVLSLHLLSKQNTVVQKTLFTDCNRQVQSTRGCFGVVYPSRIFSL